MNFIQSLVNLHKIVPLHKQIPSFREGQIFHGHVRKLMPNNMAHVELSGKQIVAKLEAPLQAENHYWFQVEKSESTPVLKVIAPFEFTKEGQSNDKSFELLLKQLGLPSTTKHKAILSFLKNEGLPFSKSFLQKTVSLLKNENMNQSVAVLKLMVDRNLPIRQSIFNALNSLASNKPFVSQLQQIVNSLNKTPNLSPSAVHLNDNLLKMIDQLHWMKSDGGTSLASIENEWEKQFPLKTILKILGFHYEKNLTKFLKGHVPIDEFKNQLMTIKPTLLALLKEDIPKEIKTLLQETVQRITGQQLLFKNNDSMMQLFFQLPILNQFGKPDSIVHFQGKQKKGQIDPDFCRILFYLNLEKLNEIVVDVQIQNRIISLSIYNENEYPVTKLKPLEQLLKTRLDQVGYNLTSVKWMKQTVKQHSFDNMYSEHAGSFQGVDVKI